MTFNLVHSISRNRWQAKKLIDNPAISHIWNFYSTKNTNEPIDYVKKYNEQEAGMTMKDKHDRDLKYQYKFFKDFLMSWKDKERFKNTCENALKLVPPRADVVIIGGGIMGSSIAYWLKKRVYEELSVVVIEKDPTYFKASTTLSVGGLRQQFSLKENIEMSLYGAEFMRNINEHLGIPGEPPIDVHFHPYGYLTLATEQDVETLTQISRLQNSLGANNVILTPRKLKEMFPWITTDGIAAGCLGLEKEGWFDPWSLLCAFKNKAISLGVQYVTGEAKAFDHGDAYNLVFEDESDKRNMMLNNLNSIIVETPDGELHKIKFSRVVIAAGAFSAQITQMAHIGNGGGLLAVPLPVEPRKRYVYCIHCPDGPGLNTPLTIDPSGVYFRREGLGGNYICGRSPEHYEEPSIDNLEVDENYFYDKVWPLLAARVKSFESLKLRSSWAGFYEYNTFDENGIIGFHPYYKNMLIATGFSGHGIQQAPAVGLAVSELLTNSKFVTIDLSKLGFDRFVYNEPMREANIF